MLRWILFVPVFLFANLKVGLAEFDMTPPMGTPLAGYAKRQGVGAEGVLDPLQAVAMVIDSSESRVALCSVDHLGFTEQMCARVQDHFGYDVVVGSTHTHSGSGAFLDLPFLGEFLAGRYSKNVIEHSIRCAIAAIKCAEKNLEPAQLGIGQGCIKGVSHFRAPCPKIETIDRLTVIKVLDLQGNPKGALINFALHPTVLTHENLRFSADFVGDLRRELPFTALYFNGAQAEVIPKKGLSCAQIGNQIARAVVDVWDKTPVAAEHAIECVRHNFTFNPQPTPGGLIFPIKEYASEVGVLKIGDFRFLLVPGELSVAYEKSLAEEFSRIAIFGLCNGAHGYLITPEAWDAKTMESQMSFGGREHGDRVVEMLRQMVAQF